MPGGREPTEIGTLTPLLAEALADVGVDTSSNPDLQPFGVLCLHPGRTLIEKLMILNSKIGSATTRDEIVAGRLARHFYDVYELLGDERVLAVLNDRRVFDEIVTENLAVSQAFEGDAPRPVGGFAKAYAFNASDPHRDELRGAYTDGIDALYYGPLDELPTWDAIEDRVRERADLL